MAANENFEFFTEDTWSQTCLWRQKTSPHPGDKATQEILPYIDTIERLSNGHPNLTFLSNELKDARGTHDEERGRAAVLEFSQGQSPISIEFSGPNKVNRLEKYFQQQHECSCSRLYILEDIATKFVETLGSNLCIHPSFFATQLRTTLWENSQTASNPPILPSMTDGGLVFQVHYPELVKFGDRRFRMYTDLYCCSNVYRGISVLRLKGFYDDIGRIFRKLSFWSRRNLDGTWNGEL